MKKRISIILMLLIVAGFVFAVCGSTIVYITKTGEKYHRDGCSSLRKSKIEITLSEAVSRGYGPCKNCNPPVLTK